MPNLTSVGIASGVPNSGTGTVSTLDALMADGGQATLGAKADAKSSATDTTPVSAMSVLKQISASVQATPALAAGTNTIGSVQGISTKVAVAPTVTAATYAISKVVGGIMTFANILPGTPFGAVLESITVKFKGSVQTVGFWVAIFDASPAGTFTDTNTAAINAADTAHLLGMYHLTVPVSLLGTHTIYTLDGIGKAIQGASANLYAVVVPDATTAALGSTSDMTVELGTLWG